MNKNIITVIIIAAAIVVAGVVIGRNSKCPADERAITAQEAADRVIDFVNVKVLAGQAEAALTEVLEENGLYKVLFTVQGQDAITYITKDGKLFFPEWLDLTLDQNQPVAAKTTIGNFTVNEDQFCAEDGKPVVYFFGSESCSHCQWEHPIIEEVAAKFGGSISFHSNMDSDADMDVFQKYSPGSIPTLVLGCRYSRVGSGENAGEEQEAKDLTALVCKLTDGNPSEVCQEVQDLIDQAN